MPGAGTPGTSGNPPRRGLDAPRDAAGHETVDGSSGDEGESRSPRSARRKPSSDSSSGEKSAKQQDAEDAALIARASAGDATAIQQGTQKAANAFQSGYKGERPGVQKQQQVEGEPPPKEESAWSRRRRGTGKNGKPAEGRIKHSIRKTGENARLAKTANKKFAGIAAAVAFGVFSVAVMALTTGGSSATLDPGVLGMHVDLVDSDVIGLDERIVIAQQQAGEAWDVPWTLLTAWSLVATEAGKLSPYDGDLCDRDPDREPLRNITLDGRCAGEQTTFPTVDPPIGDPDNGDGLGPYLLLPAALDGVDVDPQNMAASGGTTVRTGTDLFASLLAAQRDSVLEERDVDVDDLEGADLVSFWSEVLSRVPVADPRFGTCSAPTALTTATQTVTAIQQVWRCELMTAEALESLSPGGDLLDRVQAVDRAVDEAVTVAWLFSEFGTLPERAGAALCAKRDGAPDDVPVGVFPLSQPMFEAFAPNPELTSRCDASANIVAAARAFAAGEGQQPGTAADFAAEASVGDRTSRAGVYAPQVGGWWAFPWALGLGPLPADQVAAGVVPTDDALVFARKGPWVPWRMSERCEKAAFAWVSDMVDTELQGAEQSPPAPRSVWAKIGGQPKLLDRPRNRLRADAAVAYAEKDLAGSRACRSERVPAPGEFESALAELVLGLIPESLDPDQAEGHSHDDLPVGECCVPPPLVPHPPTSTLPPEPEEELSEAEKLRLRREFEIRSAVPAGLASYLRVVARELPVSPVSFSQPGADSVIARLSASGRRPDVTGRPASQRTSALSDTVLQVAHAIGGIEEEDAEFNPDADLQDLLSAAFGSVAGVSVGSVALPGIPQVVVDAMVSALQQVQQPQYSPGCTADLAMMLGAAQSESGSYWDQIGPNGISDPPIISLAPVAGPDTDGGALDGTAADDRAMGIFQFIPKTWTGWVIAGTGYASDGNGDGVMDPQNAFDNSLGGARYICSNLAGRDANDPAVLREIYGQFAWGSRWTPANQLLPEYSNIVDKKVEDTLAMRELIAAQGVTALSLSGGGFSGPISMPPGVTALIAAESGWGGYQNGYIPPEAMLYTPTTGQVHPLAGEMMLQMQAAATQAGHDISGYCYRPAATQEATYAGGTGARPGNSNHGWGLACDLTGLTGAGTPSFSAPAALWLCQNSGRFGWGYPAWAMPLGYVCNGIVGNGRGGGTAGVLEPWHVEFIALAGIPYEQR
jgi:hypothetical protein